MPWLARLPRRWLAWIALVSVAVVAAPCSLLKIWRVTPDGFVPVIRVSVLDRVQARALGVAAARHLAGGRVREAGLSWREAVANNPGDMEVIRAWTRAAIASGRRFAIEDVIPWNESFWMLRLGGTNNMDLDLVVQLMGRMDHGEGVLAMGMDRFSGLGVAGAGEVVKAVFRSGDMQRFDAMWSERADEFEADAELALYRAAWKAQWGPGGTAGEGRRMLESALGDPRLRAIALWLNRRVAMERMDVGEHGRWLALLTEEGSATVGDHVDHWNLLHAAGRRDEARRLAMSASVPVARVRDAKVLGEAFLGMGMADEALAVTERLPAGQVPDDQLAWVKGRALQELRRWDDLRALGLSLRGNPRLAPLMAGCAHAMEAIASRNLNRPEAAAESARRAGEDTNGPPQVVVPLALKLGEAGFPAEALAMLRGVAWAMGGSKEYWKQRMGMAGAAGDTAEFKVATAEIVRMEPGNPAAANNHAVAMLLAREGLPEALRITFANHAKFPGSAGFAINHAMALTLNDRPDDAARVLLGIPVTSLKPDEFASYRIAWFDIMTRRKDWDGARKQLDGVDLGTLLEVQRARVMAELSQFPPP